MRWRLAKYLQTTPTKKKRMVGLDSTSFPFFCGARLFFRGNPCFKCQFCSEFIGVELAQPIPKRPPQQRTKTKDLSENSCKCADIKKRQRRSETNDQAVFKMVATWNNYFFVHAKFGQFFGNCLVNMGFYWKSCGKYWKNHFWVDKKGPRCTYSKCIFWCLAINDLRIIQANQTCCNFLQDAFDGSDILHYLMNELLQKVTHL